jgi:hypothetical protein
LFFEPLTARGVNITETGGQHHRNIHLSRNVDEIKYVELEEGHESLRKDENRLIYDFFNEHNR